MRSAAARLLLLCLPCCNAAAPTAAPEVAGPPALRSDPYYQPIGATVTTQMPTVIVRNVVQDTHGHLWFATFGGPLRYDGTNFVNFGDEVGLARTRVFAALAARDGAMWFGSITDGARRWDGKSSSRLTTANGLPHDDVFYLFEDRDRRIWIATAGGVARFDGAALTTFTTKDGLPHDSVYAIAQGLDGRMWFGTQGGVGWWDGERFGDIDAEFGRKLENVRAVAVAPDGNVWFGSQDGAFRYDGKHVAAFTTEDGLLARFVGSMCIARDGAVWFGHPGGFPSGTGGGASRYDGKRFEHYTPDQGLDLDNVYCVFEDRDGNLWFGSANAGVRRFDGKSFTSVSRNLPLRR